MNYNKSWLHNLCQVLVRMAVTAFVLVCIGTLHCDGASPPGGSIDDADGANHILSFVEITPFNDILTVDLNTVGILDFVVFAHYADGSSHNVTDQVTLSNANDSVGMLSANRFTSTIQGTNKVDFTSIVASYSEMGQTMIGIANLTVVCVPTHIECDHSQRSVSRSRRDSARNGCQQTRELLHS